MTNVFVSYSRKDSAAARKLIEAFKTIELDVWVDWEDIPPAVGGLDQILRGIEESDAFIFFISPDSVASEVCNVEVGHSGKNNKRIIPVVLRDVDPKTVNPIIRDLNWIFIREQDGLEEGIKKIRTAIDLDIEWVEEHRRLQVRALEWDRKKDPSLLLRGGGLRYAEKMVKSAAGKDPKPTFLQKVYIQHSLRDERRKIFLWGVTALTVIMMAILSFTAYRQSRLEAANASLALENQRLAEQKAAISRENEQIAREAQSVAETSENLAEAQRSAARAQIYQSRMGELYTSTLLAIDSWQRHPSTEAEEILRKNISLLPIPVAQMGQLDRINSLEFSPDGDTFVTASADNTACVWNVKDGTRLFCAASSGSVNDAVFSPGGEIVVTGDSEGVVQILDAGNGKVKNEFNFGVPVWDVNISPDGQLLAAARDDGKITVIDLETPKDTYDLQTPGSLFVSTFSPDGAWIAAGSSSGSVTIWNLIDGRIVAGPVHKGEVFAIEFSPNSNMLVTGGADSAAFVTQTSTGKEFFHILNEDWVEDIAFSPDGSWFVTVSDDRRIRVWDTASGNERIRMLQDSFVQEVKVSSNGQWIATTGPDKTIRVWNAATGAEIFQIPLTSGGSVLAFSADGKYLVSGDQGGEIDIWDIASMSAPASYVQFQGFTENVQFSASGDWLAASDENRIWLLDEGRYSTLTARPQGKPTLELTGHVKNLLIGPDSKWIGISTDAGEVVLYDVEKRTSKTISQSNFEQQIAFSPDGLQLITGDSDGRVQAWDLSTGELAGTLLEADSSVMSLGTGLNLLAIGLEDKIIILNMSTGQMETEIEFAGDHQHIALDPDGLLLASSTSSGQVNIWGEANGGFVLLHTLPSEQVFAMSFNPKGDRLIIGALNNVYLIDPATGGEIARIPHKNSVNSLAFSADGRTLATASLKVIQFWDVSKIPVIEADNLVETACARLTRNFDQAQWSAFFGDDEEYRTLCENLPSP